jgi:hypothetical protein
MVPTTLWKQANAALKNDYIAAGTSNTLMSTGFTINLVMNPRLSSQAYIYVFRADSDVRALVWQDEVLPVMQYEFDIQKDMHVFPAKRVSNGGYGRFDQTCRVEFT